MTRHALVLAAGLGTRLRPLTDVRAKPAIPVAGEPMIRRIVAWLVASGVDDLVVNLHHRPETVTAALGDGSDLSARVRYSWEPVVLGSAGGPRQALAIVGAETFLVINGDTITDVDVRALFTAHEASGALVTLALVPNLEPDRYGGVRVDRSGRVVGFARRGAAGDDARHFVGVQAVRAEVFRDLPAGVPLNSIGDVYDRLLAARPGAIRGFVTDARFFDVGTVADYWRTSSAFATASSANLTVGQRAVVDPTARVSRSILWDDVVVEGGATIDECIVTDGVRVAAGSTHCRKVLVRRGEETIVSPLAV